MPPWEPGTRILGLKWRRQTLVLPQAAKTLLQKHTVVNELSGEVFHFFLGHHGPTLSRDFSSFGSWKAWKMERLERKRTCTENEKTSISNHSQASFSRLYLVLVAIFIYMASNCCLIHEKHVPVPSSMNMRSDVRNPPALCALGSC